MRCFRPSFLSALALLLAGWVVAGETRAGESAPRWVSHHYGSVDGLPVGSASSARVDADGFLWLATHDGLARFDGQRFDVHDSMRFPAMSGNRVLSIHKDDEAVCSHTPRMATGCRSARAGSGVRRWEPTPHLRCCTSIRPASA